MEAGRTQKCDGFMSGNKSGSSSTLTKISTANQTRAGGEDDSKGQGATVRNYSESVLNVR